jgi:hypothetical protein
MTVHSATALGNQHRPAVGCLVSEQSAACQEVTLGLESTAIPSRGRDRWRMPRVAIGPRARGSWSRHRHRECGQSTRLTRDCPRPTGRRPRAAAELRSHIRSDTPQVPTAMEPLPAPKASAAPSGRSPGPRPTAHMGGCDRKDQEEDDDLQPFAPAASTYPSDECWP